MEFSQLKKSTLWLSLLPFGFVLLNFLLKFKYIAHQSIGLDEAFSIYYSQFDIATIVNELGKGNNPPLHEILLHYWILLFGNGETSVRFLPCLFSSVAVYFIYKIAYSFFNRNVAIIAALLFSLNNFQMAYAQESRAYAMLLLLTCISMYLFLQLCRDSSSKKKGVALVVINVLLLYTHYMAVFVPFFQFFTLLILKESRKMFLKKYLILSGIILVLYSPFLKIFIERMLVTAGNGTWVQPVTNLKPFTEVLSFLTNISEVNFFLFIVVIWFILSDFLQEYTSKKLLNQALVVLSVLFLFFTITIRTNWWELSPPVDSIVHKLWKVGYLILYLAVLIFFIVLAIRSVKVTENAKMVLIWFFLPLLLVVIVSVWIPIYLDKYIIFLTPAFYLLMAIGLVRLEKKMGLKVSLLLIMTMLMTFHMKIDKLREIRSMVAKVKELKQEGAVIYVCPQFFASNFAYYYDPESFSKVNSSRGEDYLFELLDQKKVHSIIGSVDIDTIEMKRAKQVIYIDAAADFVYANNRISHFLTQEFGEAEVYDFPAVFKVSFFARKDELKVLSN